MNTFEIPPIDAAVCDTPSTENAGAATRRPRIMFVDDEARAGQLFKRFMDDRECDCITFVDPSEALDDFRGNGADLVVTDLNMPGMSGTELLAGVRDYDPDVPVIIITAFSTLESAIEALRLGASDFIKKPYDMDELIARVEKLLEQGNLRRENRLLKRQITDSRLRYGMIGGSPALQRVQKMIDKIADIRCNVIIQGESGTGKELAARAIHNLGQDADRPFVVVDCGALTDTLLESELFGHEKGAFTGAAHTRKGLLEAASGGTVFLDEIGNISDSMQVKLLRVVQEGQVTRVGGVRPIQIDVRFLVATNRDLDQMVRDGDFRHDLFHRLNVVKLTMPPLRERREDIGQLIQHFIDHFNARYKRSVDGFDANAMRRLRDFAWPGNVRELRNLVERHICLADGSTLTLDETLNNVGPIQDMDGDMPTLETLERRYILKVLESFEGSREQTARALGINKSTLWRKLRQYEEEGVPND
ncbi:MAG: sigma-54-dependent Fis family transcriptional regulator [Gammaproteobacteria bacterium]|nr:sigma-54-dependent Fis family transcriptional regulator [Gammaproteobacteria bacterium]MCP5138063.1 sigma-54-dependent Fis family transcriptional regulator [Gammaproteobacteria bacterium]